MTSIDELHTQGGHALDVAARADDRSPVTVLSSDCRLLGTRRRTPSEVSTGAVESENKRAPSVIVYTPGGFVGVHFPTLNRKPFASDNPTADEARAALLGYLGYYGALTVYPGEVFHNILAGVSPAAGTHPATIRRHQGRRAHCATDGDRKSAGTNSDDRDPAASEWRGRDVAEEAVSETVSKQPVGHQTPDSSWTIL